MEKMTEEFLSALCKIAAISDLLKYYTPDDMRKNSETCEGLSIIIYDAVIQLSNFYEYISENGYNI